MNKTDKIIFFIALTLILGGLTACVFWPGKPLFIPVAIGCVLLQVLRTSITVRMEAKRQRIKRRARKFKSNVKALAASIANDNKQLLTNGNKPRRQRQG